MTVTTKLFVLDKTLLKYIIQILTWVAGNIDDISPEGRNIVRRKAESEEANKINVAQKTQSTCFRAFDKSQSE